MTKKAAALLLAASLAVSVCATPVFAADPSIEKDNEATDKPESEVVYNVTGGYKWSIPATINFGSNAKIKDTKEGNERVVNANQDANIASTEADDTKNGTAPAIHVSSNVIKYGQTLQISITNDNTVNSYFETGVNKGFFITSGTDATKGQKLYYTIEKPATAAGGTATPVTALGTSILEVKAGTPTGKQELTFTLNTANGGTAEMEGNYKGTLSFTAELTGTANGSNT